MSTSIIIPAYNAKQYLARTLESVLSQTIADWEAIVVDDGSTDETHALAAAYAARDRRIRVLQQKNTGAAAARNTGYQAARAESETFLFLDADDLLETEALEKLSQALSLQPQFLGVHALGRIINGEGDLCSEGELEAWGRNRRRVAGNALLPVKLEEPTDFSVLAFINCIVSPGVMLLRREALEATGGFDVELRNAEDWDMWLRMSLNGHFYFLDACLFRYRKHASNKSSNHVRSRIAQLTIRRKLITNPALSKEQRSIAYAGFRLGERHLAAQRRDWAASSLRRGRIVDAIKHLRHAVMNLKNYYAPPVVYKRE